MSLEGYLGENNLRSPDPLAMILEIVFGRFHLYTSWMGTYFGCCMPPLKRYTKHWTCDILDLALSLGIERIAPVKTVLS